LENEQVWIKRDLDCNTTMAQNTSSEDEFSGFAPEEIPSDWIDKNNGRIYITSEM